MDSTSQQSNSRAVPTTQGAKAELESEPLLSYRALLLQKAMRHVPYTAEGLPVAFYRVDLLPNQPKPAEEELSDLSVASQDLSFEQGYPTLMDGRPFWHKLDFEPGFAYGAFQIYLEQIDEGPREIYALTRNEELRDLASRMHGFPDNTLMPEAQLGRILNEYSILYYWRPRSHAHDLYQEAAFRHLRLRRQQRTEGQHFQLSEKYLKELQEKVLNAPDFWEAMSPKTAVEMLGKLVGISRISVGLPMSGPLSQKETPEASTFEMLLRAIGKKTADVNGRSIDASMQGRHILDEVLGDRDATVNMQELVIRVSSAAANAANSNNNSTLDGNNGNNIGNRFRGRKGRREEYAITQDSLVTGFDLQGAPGSKENETDVEDADVVSQTPPPPPPPRAVQPKQS